MNTLDQIMKEYEPGTVILKSINAVDGVFIPLFHWRDHWCGVKPWKYNRLYLKWRKGDNDIWEIIGTHEPFPEDHPIHEAIQNKIKQLKGKLNFGEAICKNWETSRDVIRFKHEDYDGKNKILRKKKHW